MENQDFRLLVVDDNEDNLDMLSRRLLRRGFQVLTAEDGAQALDILERESVDLVLLDIMMPGIDGLEVLRRTRQRFSALELPIIMATAKAGSEDIVKTAELGANDHVVKPLNFKIVLAKVQALLRSKAQLPKAETSASKTTRIEPGGLVTGRYRLQELIGSGTFGAVYRAHHLDLAHDVAIKVLQPSVTANEETRRRFRLEGVAACRVQHPNAVRVTDFGVTDDGVAFLVMELLQGFPLVQELRQWQRLSPRRCLEIFRPVCDVLSHAHRNGLVHRDIKPENIFLHQSEQGEIIKLLDFGIAKLVGENTVSQNLTAEGWVLGTPAYMAPERLSNEGYDGRADVYSLGVMLFEMITGNRPFMATNNDPMSMIMRHVKEPPPSLRSVYPEAPTSLEPLIHRCLAKQPEKRPGAEDLLQELSNIVDAIESGDPGYATTVVAMEPVTQRQAATAPFPTVTGNSSSYESVDGNAPTLKVDTDSVETHRIASDAVQTDSIKTGSQPTKKQGTEKLSTFTGMTPTGTATISGTASANTASNSTPSGHPGEAVSDAVANPATGKAQGEPSPEPPPEAPAPTTPSEGLISRWVKKLRGSG